MGTDTVLEFLLGLRERAMNFEYENVRTDTL